MINKYFRCPYCRRELNSHEGGVFCPSCVILYWYDGVKKNWHFYNPQALHWCQCVEQVTDYFIEHKRITQIDVDSLPPNSDLIGHPYEALLFDNQEAVLAQRANAYLFNLTFRLLSDLLSDGGFALDVGASRGWSSFHLARHFYTVALDISNHHHLGLGSVPTNIGKGITKVLADGAVLPFADNTFSVIFMCSVFHHMTDKVVALNEWYRVLKPGGRLIAVGERPCTIGEIEGSRQLSEYRNKWEIGYTKEYLQGYFDSCQFTNISHIHVGYSLNMGYMDEFVEGCDNGIIYAKKEGK